MRSPHDVLPRLYDELRRLAAAKPAHEGPGHSLDATTLVHEARLRLAEASAEWHDRNHFLRAAATAMRRILVDRARARQASKRGGGAVRVDGFEVAMPVPDAEISALDEALDRLAALQSDHARLVELRAIAGLTGDESAAAPGVSPATADGMQRYARAWLQVEGAQGPSRPPFPWSAELDAFQAEARALRDAPPSERPADVFAPGSHGRP